MPSPLRPHVTRLPSFLVIGAAKAGTTSLYHYLAQHPDIYMSPVKEPRFFAHEGAPSPLVGKHAVFSSVTRLEDYLALFEEAGACEAVGEASPGYLYEESAPARIKCYVPEARLIAILRHPAERAFSNYTMLKMQGREPLPFAEALEAEDERVREGWSSNYHYRRAGLYAEQLERYYSGFPREQIRIYLYEDLQRDLVGLMRNMYGFVGVSPSFVPKTERYNVSGIPCMRLLYDLTRLGRRYKSALPAPVARTAARWSRYINQKNLRRPEMLAATRRKLTASFQHDVERLEALIERRGT